MCLTLAFIDAALDGGTRPPGNLGDLCLVGSLDIGCAPGLRCDTSFPGGYCSTSCQNDSACGDGLCRTRGLSPGGICYQSCFGLDTQSTCRPGYSCQEGQADMFDQGVCAPASP